MQPAPSWPIAFALAALRAGAPCRETLLAFAPGWAENMVQAALKSVPLGQTAGQRVLSVLTAAIPGLVDAAMLLGDEDRPVCMPALAILSVQQRNPVLPPVPFLNCLSLLFAQSQLTSLTDKA
jgi:urease accessory protein